MNPPPSEAEPNFNIEDSTVQEANFLYGDGNHAMQGDGQQGVLGNQNQVVQIAGNSNTIVLQERTIARCPRIERLLLYEVKGEVKDRRRQSLHNQVYIQLGKTPQPEQVHRLRDATVKVGDRSPMPIAEGTTISAVFDRDDIDGKLLILGEPGAGKTTTMLDLAAALISKSVEHIDAAMPVLFNLSRWQDDQQAIADWLLQELKLKYGVRLEIGKALLAERKLLPLLDGLDELAPERQEKCVQAINHWLKSDQRPSKLLVCSRFEEYDTYDTNLDLNGAIYLQPLKARQVKAYLEKTATPGLWMSVSQDAELLDLLKTPLWLSVMTLAHANIDLSRWQQLDTSQARLSELLDGYLRAMLHRPLETDRYTQGKAPSAQQTRHWLIWLAQQLQCQSQDEFLVERMQPSMLATRSEKWLMRLILGLILGLLSGLVLGLIWGLIGGLIGGLLGGLIWGLIGGLIQIETVEILQFNFSREARKKIFSNLIRGLISNLIVDLTWSLIACLIGGLIWGGLTSNLRGGISLGLIVGLIWGLIEGLVGGLIEGFKADIQIKIKPNQGIRNSLQNTLWLSLMALPVTIAVWFGLPSLLGGILDTEGIKFIVATVIVVIFISIYNSGGANAFIRHYVLRFVLANADKLPFDYVCFLDHCTDRLLLQRIGGHYRFIHKTLQEHFAEM